MLSPKTMSRLVLLDRRPITISYFLAYNSMPSPCSLAKPILSSLGSSGDTTISMSLRLLYAALQCKQG